MAILAIIFLISFSAFLNVVHHFDIDNAITFLGAYLICSLYFRSPRELVYYLAFGFSMGCIALYFTINPDIEPVLFAFRLFLGGLLVLSLSFATRQFQNQLQQFSKKIAEENRSLNETKVALEERLTHEHLLALVASRANALVIISDKNDVIEWVNAAFTELTGYTSEEAIGKMPDFMRGPETDPETGKRITERKKNNPEPFHDAILIYRKDGSTVWMQIHVTPLIDENGIPERFIAIAEDITEIKKTEEELIHSREQLKTAQQQAKIGNWEWKDGNNEVVISDEMARMAGMSGRNSVEVQSLLSLVHADDVEVLKKSIENGLRRHSAFEIDFRIIINGVVKYVYLTGQAVSNTKLSKENNPDSPERTEKLFGTIQDITERKRIENEMRLAEKQYRSLFEHSQHMICIHDLKGNIMSINPAGAHAIGFEPEEIIGTEIKNFFWFNDEEDYEKYISNIRATGHAQGLLRLKKRDGVRTVWLYNNILLTDPEGSTYVLSSNVEITGRYEMEKELRRAKKLAEESLVLKDRFVTNISHELRTPMNAIVGFTDLLLKTNLSEEQREYLESVHLAGDNLTSMINDVLDLAKIEAGKIEFESKPFNVRDVMAKTHRLLSQTAFQSGLKFDWECEAGVPAYILGDELRLSQVLINLVGNAIKFTEKGFVKFICFIKSETDETIDLVFNVEDSGIGIPSDKVSSIFEPFTQASADSTRKYGGTGLGLSIVHDLVELQGGFVSVKSKQGVGSSFTVILPVKKVNMETIQQVELALMPVESPGNIHVLIVEDQPLNQQLAKKLIGDFGFTSEIAANGKIAVELLSQGNLFEEHKKYDLILMDLQMPEMDGYDATEIIRKKLQIEIPIIAITAHSSVGEREKCFSLGMNDYLVKPFRAQELYFKIASAAKKQVAGISSKMANENEQNPLRELSGGDKKFEKEMLHMLVKSISEDFELMIAAMRKKDFSVARTISHRLKSSVALAGEKEFAGMLEECEKNCAEGKIPEEVENKIVEFLERKEKLLVKLKAQMEELAIAQ
jgi:PAS domain S-box-containing protein